jgi:Na+-translocating ferredoxin:NAD+ oxidoreductase RnfC subunit
MQVEPHPMYEYRRTPLKQLVSRLGIDEYDGSTPFSKVDYEPQSVSIPLSQHVGAPALPVVQVGERVAKGQLIGEIPSGKLGARIHSSINGTVKEIGENIVIERA